MFETIQLCKLFVLDRNTWYYVTMSKKSLKKQLHKKLKYDHTMYMIP